MAPPQLRSSAEGSLNPTRFYHARRLRARANRNIQSFVTPAKVYDPRRPAKDVEFNTRLDVLGPLLREHYPVVPASCQRNLLASFDKRCNYFTNRRADRSVISGSLRLLARLVPEALSPIEWTPELFRSWNAQFPAEKQARHMKVFPLVDSCTVKQFTDKQIFVKVEALLKRHDPNWAPRVIYQSSDLHNVILGPVMQACTKRMFKSMDLETDPTEVVYSGAYAKDTEQLCQFICEGAPEGAVFIESDFSSNDKTQVRDVHLLEIQWLRRLGAPRWITSLMLHANSFAVRSNEFGMRARITNQLPTGAQSTTFRNTMWNASIVETFASSLGLRGKCLVLGDDMLLRLDNPMSTRTQQIRRAYEHVTRKACMVAKVFVRKHLSSCSFLSKDFIMTDSGFVLVPKLGKALARFNARASANEAVSDTAYLAGKALSYSYEFRHCPVLSRMFHERYLQLAPTGLVSFDGLGWNAKGAFLRRGISGVLASIAAPKTVCTRDDMTRFYHMKYNLMAMDVVELALRFIFGEEDLDADCCGRILEDFVD